ncbi:putative RNase H-like nuclease [Christiangramia gaetbulicola]|uniref:Putative RNase H-like nuclease n=1 Tax=Christiangramia gaetbulicola TaxID=703340 RepID=A0A2T6AKK2_9FLAO|nr:DUF429 domain-containing protein [Christiangramia gaetbulicola]PTX44352.1 putative RNase H-like nuclease [Christiangramia gaetbulicola]
MKYLGVDGCKGGWISACYGSGEILIFRNIEELVSHYQDEFLMFVDIPIGLASAKNKKRNCEKEARKLLSAKRKSSIFPVPCWESLEGQNYEDAKGINRKVLGCGISKQTWFIMPKIKEVNSLLIDNRSLQSVIKESHPEISFKYLNLGIPLGHSKKTEKGIIERLEILTKYKQSSPAIFHKALQTYRKKEVAKDDILDALCLSVTAELSEKYGRSVPLRPMTDEFGIEMAINYATGL